MKSQKNVKKILLKQTWSQSGVIWVGIKYRRSSQPRGSGNPLCHEGGALSKAACGLTIFAANGNNIKTVKGK